MTQRQKAHDLLKSTGYSMETTVAPRSKAAMNHRAGNHAAAAPHGAYDEGGTDPATGLARGGLPKPRVKGARHFARPKAPHLNAGKAPTLPKMPKNAMLPPPDDAMEPDADDAGIGAAGVPSAIPPSAVPPPDEPAPMPPGMKRGGKC